MSSSCPCSTVIRFSALSRLAAKDRSLCDSDEPPTAPTGLTTSPSRVMACAHPPSRTIRTASSIVSTATTLLSSSRTAPTTPAARPGSGASGFADTIVPAAHGVQYGEPSFSSATATCSGAPAPLSAASDITSTALPRRSCFALRSACRRLRSPGTTMAPENASSAWAMASSQPSSTWMKSASRPIAAT